MTSLTFGNVLEVTINVISLSFGKSSSRGTAMLNPKFEDVPVITILVESLISDIVMALERKKRCLREQLELFYAIV